VSPIVELALVLALLFYVEGVRWVPAGTVASRVARGAAIGRKSPYFSARAGREVSSSPDRGRLSLERYVTAPHPRAGASTRADCGGAWR
jgi:hypothetical protein